MTDEQTAANIMQAVWLKTRRDSDGKPMDYWIGSTFRGTADEAMKDKANIEAAIVRALQQAREEGRLGESRSTSNMIRLGALAQCAGGILDCTGKEPVVRRVLGVLPVTADGCVIGTNATVFGVWTPQWSFGEPSVTCSTTSGVVSAPHACYSTREAAEAAKEAKK